jgi:hypothetical protein
MRDWFWVRRNLHWVVFVTCSALDTQAAGGRIALVIGNSAYEHARPLTNPIQSMLPIHLSGLDAGNTHHSRFPRRLS